LLTGCFRIACEDFFSSRASELFWWKLYYGYTITEATFRGEAIWLVQLASGHEHVPRFLTVERKPELPVTRKNKRVMKKKTASLFEIPLKFYFKIGCLYCRGALHVWESTVIHEEDDCFVFSLFCRL
jgi:hypothetical protein